jgi:hypothetical protein
MKMGLVLCALVGAAAGPLQAGEASTVGPFAALGRPVQTGTLESSRGRQETRITAMEVDARLHDNRAVDTISGGNIISDNAFSSSSGLPVAIQNSGNNVIIQNAFILNLELK